LAPDSDAVIYQERVIHVAAWAERFLFSAENLNQRVGRLSGGERARVLIAQTDVAPADVLLLDEPTNDSTFRRWNPGRELARIQRSVVLVTHRPFHAGPRFDRGAGAGWNWGVRSDLLITRMGGLAARATVQSHAEING